MRSINKKGQLQMFSRIAIAIIPLVIGLVVAFLIIGQGTTQAESLISTTAILNETVVSSAGNDVQLVRLSRVPGSTACTLVTNNTFVTVPAANYSCGDLGFNLNEANYGGCCNVSYTYLGRDSAWNSTATLKEAVDIVPDFASIIVIAMLGGALIGVTLLFRNR